MTPQPHCAPGLTRSWASIRHHSIPSRSPSIGERPAKRTTGLGRGTEVTEKQYDQDEIEARKRKYTRGWIVEPPVPYPDYSPGEEIERWYAVIGVRRG